MFSIKNTTQSSVGGIVFGDIVAEGGIWKMDRPIRDGIRVAIKAHKKFYRDLGITDCGIFSSVAELNFFRRLAAAPSPDRIVSCVGILENAKQSVIFFECGDMDLYEYFFETSTYNTKLSTHKATQILEEYVRLVDAVLPTLETLNVVYCDWKPQNILVFDGGVPNLKLCDFGSCLVADESVPNPKTTNRLFGSPNLSPLLSRITPSKYDDHKGASYLYCTLAGVALPWLTLRARDVGGDGPLLLLDETVAWMKCMPHLFNLRFAIKHKRPWLEALDQITC